MQCNVEKQLGIEKTSQKHHKYIERQLNSTQDYYPDGHKW